MEVRQNQSHDSLQEQLLADFLDWYDAREKQLVRSTAFDSSLSEVESLVDEFLSVFDAGMLADENLRTSLISFASDMLPASRAAADAVTCWIDPASCAEDRSPLQPGEETLPRPFGDYELLERIGLGGMGVVYRARQKSLGRTVCVKMLPPGLLEPRRMRQFTEESRLAGSLHHSGIVPVFDAGSHDGQPFYAMEFIDGETLAERISRRPLTATEAASLLSEIAEAVEFAHDAGVLHRDLKPANVLIDRQGRIRVTDFGLARHVDQSVTEAGVAGTPSYMAAEQVRGQPVDARTDVYGLGAILYEMLSGRPPHVGNSVAETMRLVTEDIPIRLSRLRPNLPRDLETICHKCLEKETQRRYSSAASLHEDILRFLHHEPIRARRTGAAERGVRWAQRHPGTTVAGGVSIMSLLLLLSGGALALWKTQAALERTRTAESTQRRLAGELAVAKADSDAALYRALIVQAVRSLETHDVTSARRSLRQIDSLTDFAGSPPLEYMLLHRQAYPSAASLAVDGATVRDAAWTSEKGSIAALLEDGRLALFGLDGSQIQQTQRGADVRSVAVHPNRKLVATLNADGALWVSNTSDLQLQYPVDGLSSALEMQWQPNGSSLLLLSDDGTLWQVDPASDARQKIDEVAENVSRFRVSPDGRWLAYATQEDGAFVVKLNGEGVIAGSEATAISLEGTGSWLVDLAWSVRGHTTQLAAANERGEVVVWAIEDRRGPDQASAHQRLSSTIARGDIASICWQGSHLLVAYSAGQVTALDVEKQAVLWMQPCLPVRKLRGSDDGETCLVLHESGVASIWKLSELGVAIPVYGNSIPLRSVTVGEEGAFVACRDIDGNISIIDPRRSQKVETIVESTNGASALAASPREPLFAVTRDSDVLVYQVPTVEPVIRFAEHESTVWNLAFSPDGRWLASGGGEPQVGIISVHQPSRSRLLDALSGEVRAVTFSPDSRRLAVIDGNAQVTIWDVASATLTHTIPLGNVNAHSIAYTDEQQVVIGDSSGTLHAIDIDRNRKIRRWKIHKGPIWSIVVTAKRIVSAGQDGSICISDARGRIYHRLPKQSSAVWSLAFDRTNGALWATTVSGDALRWQIGTATRSTQVEPDMR